MKKRVLVLGCTGSIGTSALDCIRKNPDRLELAGLSAHSRINDLLSLASEFNCAGICVSGNIPREKAVSAGIPYYGAAGLLRLIAESKADLVLNGIAGAAGLAPSIAALENGMDLALANKETIVTAGFLIRKLAQKNNCKILPVDSEHSAIFTLIEKIGNAQLDSIVLTASGGPFKYLKPEELERVKPEDALRHPTWNMGTKITIDSATLANKGLEVIEACRLFDMPAERVQTVIHPQSLVHSLVRTADGVLYAQISKPDMRHPILTALCWPDFLKNDLKPLDFWEGCELSFFKPRFEDFPLLPLAYEAAKKNGLYTTAYNAANEVAVSSFLSGGIGFTGIARVVEQVLQDDWTPEPASFDDVFEADGAARKSAQAAIHRMEKC